MLNYQNRKNLKTTAILLVLLIIIGILGCQKVGESQPDIVLVTLDTTRWDYLHSYGYPLPNTPNLDKLATMGSRYLNATTVAGTTFPAHASILTGLYPRRHGARSNFLGINSGVKTIAQILTAQQYQTGSFVSFKDMHKYGHLDRGFKSASDRERVSGDNNSIRPGNETLAMALNWLAKTTTQKPIFLWLHLFEPHSPYEPGSWFKQNFPNYDGTFVNGVTTQQVKTGRHQNFSGRDLEAMGHIYAGEIALADQYLGELINQLEIRGKLENTLLIIAADHGQGMGENGQFGHGARLWESVLHIPLIIVDFRKPLQATVEQRVGLIDISPTILRAVGLEIPANMAGRPLFPLNNPSNGEDRLYFSEVLFHKDPDENTRRWYDANDLAVYMGSYKLERHKGQYQLFVSSNTNNTMNPIALEGSESLFYYLSDAAVYYLEHAGKVEPQQLDASTIKELQGLGYTQ